MQYIRLGKAGVKVSRLSLGTMAWGNTGYQPWAKGEAEGRVAIKAALDAGINFIDTADTYSKGQSEEIVGRALKDFAKRDEIVLATKVCRPMGPGPNNKGLSRKHIMESIDASLKRLGTDYVDLYIIHRFDAETPIDETIQALDDVVKSGKALYVGASAMLASQFAKMVTLQQERGLATFVSMQNYYNLIHREEERDMMPFCLSEGIAVTPFSPLARGFLSGNAPTQGQKTFRAQTDTVIKRRNIGGFEQDHVILDRLMTVSEKLGASLTAVSLAWMFSKPFITAPVIGISRPDQLDEQIKGIDLKLDAEMIKLLEEPYKPKEVSGID
jgi:aryl-alcohol dehydrogenase-like predicted oxidoreductase